MRPKVFFDQTDSAGYGDDQGAWDSAQPANGPTPVPPALDWRLPFGGALTDPVNNGWSPVTGMFAPAGVTRQVAAHVNLERLNFDSSPDGSPQAASGGGVSSAVPASYVASAGPGHLNLVLQWENSALAAPQSFRNGMQAAANIMASLILDPITVTILVGYGDFNNGQITGITTGAVGGDYRGVNTSYSTVRSALASHATSAADQTFVNSLPNTSSLQGVSTFYVPSATAKALGLMANDIALDGAVGMGNQ